MVDEAADAAAMSHLQLQNGTIWRWNRPLVGFDGEGTPHARIEHRVIPGGPSTVDAIANAALFFGLAHYHAVLDSVAPSERLAFATARDNFYAGARRGLQARTVWSDGAAHPVGRLLRQRLVPCAREGLADLGIKTSDIAYYLGVIDERVRTGLGRREARGGSCGVVAVLIGRGRS
ncbi:MAG: hypothetical protein BRD57_03425 [Proteobacteria bacterium SW_6_67_9]|nr:MAG: hypothetical protein BRD57_03425 [Proteobacteria bacterium SW_6_67_9]